MSNETTVEEAFEKIKLFFQLKRNSPEVFRFRNPNSDEVAMTFQNQNFLFLPSTPEGYSVVYASLKNFSVSTFIFDSVAKTFFMTAGEMFDLNHRTCDELLTRNRVMMGNFVRASGSCGLK